MTAVGSPCGPWGRGCGSACAFQDKELLGEEVGAHGIQLPEEEGAEEKEEEKKEEEKKEEEEKEEEKKEELKEDTDAAKVSDLHLCGASPCLLGLLICVWCGDAAAVPEPDRARGDEQRVPCSSLTAHLLPLQEP